MVVGIEEHNLNIGRKDTFPAALTLFYELYQA